MPTSSLSVTISSSLYLSHLKLLTIHKWLHNFLIHNLYHFQKSSLLLIFIAIISVEVLCGRRNKWDDRQTDGWSDGQVKLYIYSYGPTPSHTHTHTHTHSQTPRVTHLNYKIVWGCNFINQQPHPHPELNRTELNGTVPILFTTVMLPVAI